MYTKYLRAQAFGPFKYLRAHLPLPARTAAAESMPILKQFQFNSHSDYACKVGFSKISLDMSIDLLLSILIYQFLTL